MTLTTSRDLAAKIKSALTLVEANRETVDAIKQGEAEALAAQQAAEKAAAERAAKAAKARPERARILSADFAASWSEAIAAAADRLAKQQVEQECGVTAWQTLAIGGPPPAHLSAEAVAREHARIVKERPLPWAPKVTPRERQVATMTAAQAAAPKADPVPSAAHVTRGW